MANHIQRAIQNRKRNARKILFVFMIGVFGISSMTHAMLPMMVLAMGGGGMMHGMMHGASGHGEKHEASRTVQPGAGHEDADPAAQRNAEARSLGGDHDHNLGGDNPRPERTQPPTSATLVQSGK